MAISKDGNIVAHITPEKRKEIVETIAADPKPIIERAALELGVSASTVRGCLREAGWKFIPHRLPGGQSRLIRPAGLE
jgi:hypothetical protein